MGVPYYHKREVFGKFEQHCFGLAMLSYHATSFQKKNPRKADHENKVAKFLLEFPLVQKGNVFLENWLIWLMSNYCTTSC